MMEPVSELVAGLKWSSHVPALTACFVASRGPVLELGVGHFSTPILHAMCAASGRELISIESDSTWGFSAKKAFVGRYHNVLIGDYDKVLPHVLKNTRFGLSFVDNSPGGQRRFKDFVAILPHSQFVVVHDYEGENEQAIRPLLGNMNHIIAKRVLPPTLIVGSDLSRLEFAL